MSEGVRILLHLHVRNCRQQDLRKILKAFAHYNDDIGYCQVRTWASCAPLHLCVNSGKGGSGSGNLFPCWCVTLCGGVGLFLPCLSKRGSSVPSDTAPERLPVHPDGASPGVCIRSYACSLVVKLCNVCVLSVLFFLCRQCLQLQLPCSSTCQRR